MNDRQLPFTGRRRERSTHWGVRATDVVSRSVITVGGIGTIIAVCLVALFLIWVIRPLIFGESKVDEQLSHATSWAQAKPVHVALDEHQSMGWALFSDGRVQLFRGDTGEPLGQMDLAPDANATAWSVPIAGDELCVGFDDGTIRVIRLRFKTEFLEAEQVPESLRALAIGEVTPYRGGVVEKTPIGQYRLQTLQTRPIGEPRQLLSGPVRLIDHSILQERLYIAAVTDAGTDGPEAAFASGQLGVNKLTDEPQARIERTWTLDDPRLADEVARFCRISELGDNLYLAWADGRVHRYRTNDPNGPRRVEQLDIVPGEQVQLTAFDFLLGRTTLLTGTSEGAIDAYFPAPIENNIEQLLLTGDGGDGMGLAHARHLRDADGAAITTLAASPRSRAFVAGTADGKLIALFTTGGQPLAQTSTGTSEPILAASVAPEADGVVGLSGANLLRWDFYASHPEATTKLLFDAVWYEGYAGPIFEWESSSGTGRVEPKLSMIPLIFGTLKATFYTMLFGTPLALLAAVFTSEFLHPRAKSRIKPTIEMMASLPSVVLGFLAALVFAPMISKIVPSTLALMFTAPLTFLVGAYIWQLLPYRLTVRWREQRFWFVLLVSPAAVIAAMGADWVPLLRSMPLLGSFEGLGAALEEVLFNGDIKQWLNGLERDPAWGGAFGGLLILLLPISVLLMSVAMGLYVNPFLRWRAGHFSRGQAALLDIIKFLAGTVVTLGVASALAGLLAAMGFDLRHPVPYVGSVFGTYNLGNGLVIGLVMGFAIIPIIYTIAEDALSTVPEHLRSGSLGAGATPWQTAIRIVIPTAMSGLFSAVMIGLGRAVGETMIVLMAFRGNYMDMNVFNGGRTLSLNVAFELPEAPVGSTHYRTLFFSALVLFAMTFAVNTVAEFVRLRFRRRAYSL